MARWAKNRGIRVFYYIAPQVWAWKENRVEKMKKHIDRLMVILPFERSFFRKHGMGVDYVGHPLIDEIVKRDRKFDIRKPKEQKQKEGVIVLLPGSRKAEIRHVLPEMLKVQKQFPNYHFIIGKAQGMGISFYKSEFNLEDAEVSDEGTYKLLSRAKVALVTSGTATLETALLRVPQVVCYKAGRLSVRIARNLIKVPYISLVNLILDRHAVRELIQQELNSTNLIEELGVLLHDTDAIEAMQNDYNDLWEKLGGGGASAKAAKLIVGDVT